MAPRRLRHQGAALLALWLGACASDTPPEPESAQPGFEVSWAGPVDFTDLRTKYGDREDYSALCDEGRPLRELYDAANREDWQTVLAVSGPWLIACPVDIDAHYLRAIACDKTGRAIDSTHHAIWFQGLVGSVLDSGAGEADDPYVVISIAEEYALLRALHLDPEEQRLVSGGVDAITARDSEGATVTLFFRPDAHWRRLRKAFPED